LQNKEKVSLTGTADPSDNHSKMNEQIASIKAKINQLKKLDKSYSLFGSQKHKYRLNSTLPINKIKQFELTHKINLPNEYVAFLMNIGNGGAGPFYGLEPLENSLFDDLDYKRPDSLLNPSEPFLHVEPWNLKFNPTVEEENEEEFQKQLSLHEEKYYAPEQRNGVLAICNYGCAVSINLVVNGKEYGKIWTDDRGSDGGIYPSHELGNENKITFLNWYELWLDNSFKELGHKPSTPDTIATEIAEKDGHRGKPWWKIW